MCAKFRFSILLLCDVIDADIKGATICPPHQRPPGLPGFGLFKMLIALQNENDSHAVTLILGTTTYNDGLDFAFSRILLAPSTNTQVMVMSLGLRSMAHPVSVPRTTVGVHK